MPFIIPADAPQWVHVIYWIGFVAFGLLFTLIIPRLRHMLSAAVPTQPQPDVALRAIGAGISGSLDVAKVTRDLERIADSVETIAEAATSLAKSEEAGTARTLGSMAEMLARLDRRIERR